MEYKKGLRNKPTKLKPKEKKICVKNIHWRKDNLLNKWQGKSGFSHVKNKIRFHLSCCTRNQFNVVQRP